MATKYWTGSKWILQDGSTTTPPGAGDIGVLGGTLTGHALAQSGAVPFFGATTFSIGSLIVAAGTGPWTIEGTGATDSTIPSLIVAAGATVTVNSQIAVRGLVIEQAAGVTTPASVTLNDGLPPRAVIDFQDQASVIPSF